MALSIFTLPEGYQGVVECTLSVEEGRLSLVVDDAQNRWCC